MSNAVVAHDHKEPHAMATNLLSTLVAKFYSSASNARRAARSAGVQFSGVTQSNEGWQIVPQVEANTFGDQLGGHTVPDMPLVAVEVTTTPVLAPAHKLFAKHLPSTVVGPVEYVHSFLNANPNMGRKQAMFELVAKGVNYSTARTQYQRWFKARQG